MKANILRALVALSALALLLGGCSIGRHVAPPRTAQEEAAQPSLASQVGSLRQENDRLRKQQADLQASLDDLQHTLSQVRDEQRQYRETMTRNFDLLEQSVSLTLSKSITADLGQAPPPSNALHTAAGSAAQAPVAAKRSAGAKGEAQADAPTKESTPTAEAQGNAQASPLRMREVLTASGDPALVHGHPNADQATPVAMVTAAPGGQAPPEMDPDLADPAHPRKLTAHPEAQPLYEKGFALFARKDYSQARLVFKNFLKRFPDDVYSDNAQFWIGECYLNEHRPAEAEAAYRTVLRTYAHRSTLEGYKAPDAMFRLGQLYARRGQVQHARQFFSLLAKRFPDTSPGRRAQRELDQLGGNSSVR